MGRPIAIESEDQRVRPDKSEVERLLASHARATELLGWTPAVSLEDGLERTIAWLADNREKYRPHAYAI